MVSDEYEKDLRSKGYRYIAGVDESGIGSFAGDVYVAAVILPVEINYTLSLPHLDDSKKTTLQQRQSLYELIKSHAVAYSVATASVKEIDEINIYWAKFLAARRALSQLSITPDYVLMDGNKEIPEIDIPQQAIVKGDSKSVSIAAASILAKIDRDKHIDALAAYVHEDYDWINNKSYYAPKHIKAIKKHGKTKYHREKYVRKYLV